jgi:alkylhydroperoxidase/carboxymuconolactone decarboxylase family protein YurZ
MQKRKLGRTNLDVITQLLPWVGYPRTLNALSCLNEVSPEVITE